MTDDQQNVQPAPEKKGGANGLAIASLVLGLVLIALFWVPFLGGILAFVGLILGIIGAVNASKAGSGMGMAIAGIVLCVVFGIAAATCAMMQKAVVDVLDESMTELGSTSQGEIDNPDRVAVGTVNAQTLIDEYKNNEVKFKDERENNCYVVTGIIDDILVNDITEQPYIVFRDDADFSFDTLDCMFAKGEKGLAELEKGQQISIEGIVKVDLMGINLTQCKIVE